MDAITHCRNPHHLFPSSIREADNVFLLLLLLRLLLLVGRETPLKFLSSPGAEVVTTTDHVGPVGIEGRVEGVEEGEHFRRVPAATEDDEEVGWGPAFTGRWMVAVEGGEDIDETELGSTVS